MRYISIFTHEPSTAPPNPEMMQTMGKLVEAGMKEGWLITTEGVHFGDKPLKITRSKAGKLTVTDGPFTEAKDRAHVIELSRRFLEVAGSGTCEVHELYAEPK